MKPEEKDASLSYVFGNDLVDAVTIGMLKQSEVDDTLAADGPRPGVLRTRRQRRLPLPPPLERRKGG